MVRLTRKLAILSVLLVVRPLLAADLQEQPIVPVRTTPLINGRDLTGWYSFLRDTGREDPRDVFTVRESAIRISGDGFGYLSTRSAYCDYRLLVEFKWGKRNSRGREGKARDSGVFLHSLGPDGNSLDGEGAYKAAVECQVMEGATGDIMLIKGRDSNGQLIPLRASAQVSQERDSEGWPFYAPGGASFTVKTWGRINWRNKATDWKDEFGFRGPHDVTELPGQWNRLECICHGDRISVLVNGVLVNQVHGVFPKGGRILLQCEGSEVFFRRVELQPLRRSQQDD